MTDGIKVFYFTHYELLSLENVSSIAEVIKAYNLKQLLFSGQI